MVKIGSTFVLFFLICLVADGYGQISNNDYLLSVVDTTNDTYGYKNQNGETIIPFGKYSICFTDTFRTYAIVAKPKFGFVAIDRQENILYQIFPFDNGPDYPSEGLFRILQKGKIGFADSATGKIVIEPQFSCAFPFEKGVAKVSGNCIEKKDKDGEHSTWVSDNWYYIDKTGDLPIDR